MLRRTATQLLLHKLASYPAVSLVGPRQTGKTTLARSVGKLYFDLEQPEERVRLDATWSETIAQGGLIVLDEAQAWPQVFGRLRGAIDAERAMTGRFLLLGSVSPALMREVSDSLAGRLGTVELSPFLFGELGEAQRKRHWLVGGFPDGGILAPQRFAEWQRDYLSLLTQRDLPNWGLAARPAQISQLLRMLAAVHGQQWNASQIGQSLGTSYHTVNAHLDYLEGAFLVRRLPAFSANLTKRLVKRPKLYVRDSGLLHALLRASSFDELLGQPWVGASFEGYIIEQILGTLSARGSDWQAHYFRTSDGQELDLVLDLPRQVRWAIEIKLTTAPSPDDVAKLRANAMLVKATHTALICRKPISNTPTHLVTDLGGILAAIA